ncbi:MAG: replicative DNA helicase [Pseudohongiellaceae bacterium]
MAVIDQDTQRLKVPPHSIEAEQSILGGLMLDNSKWDVVGDLVLEEDFYRQDHRLIYRVVSRLANMGAALDVVTVAEQLEQSKELDNVGGMSYLGELVEKTPSASNVRAYASIVHERAVLRRLIAVSGEISDSAFNPEGRTTSELLDNAERKVFQIAESRAGQDGGPKSINPILTMTLEKIDLLFNSNDSITGVTTGFRDLDEMTSGLQTSDLVIVAARPSMGKTAFAMNLVESVLIKSEKPVLVFSMEMPGDSLLMRMISSLGMINQTRVRSGKLEEDDWPRLTSAVSILKDKPLFIDDTAGLSPTELRSRARRVTRELKQDIGMIMIDYLQLMQIPGFKDGRTAEISEISRSLKALAKELKCPVVALSQLNRSLEQRTDKRPMNSDLRESGAIEQDADVIMFIYRDEYYNEESPDKGMAEIIIGKQRNGPIGKCKLAFQGQYTKFVDLAPGSYDDDF